MEILGSQLVYVSAWKFTEWKKTIIFKMFATLTLIRLLANIGEDMPQSLQ